MNVPMSPTTASSAPHGNRAVARTAAAAMLALGLALSAGTLFWDVQYAGAVNATNTPAANAPASNSAGSTAARRTTLRNPLGTSSITVLVGRATRIFMGVAGSFALLMFVYGGFLWVTSGGNLDKVKKGKQVFTYAVIGLVVIYGSYLILSILFRGLQGAT